MSPPIKQFHPFLASKDAGLPELAEFFDGEAVRSAVWGDAARDGSANNTSAAEQKNRFERYTRAHFTHRAAASG